MSQQPSTEVVFSKDTFLTSLRGGGVDTGAADSNSSSSSSTATGNGSLRLLIQEPTGMTAVREKHAQLHDVVGSLSDKISAVLARQEKDFLSAYRAHMYNVQKELHEMREKLSRNETAENRTEKIKKIEEERDWYRKEALRLDAFTTSMTKDLKYMKEKLESIEEDRTWLEKQLKNCKKQNKLLRAELDVRIASSNQTTIKEVLPPAFEKSKAASGRDKSSSKRNANDSQGLPTLHGDSLLSKSLTTSDDDHKHDKRKQQLKQLRQEVAAVTKENDALKRQLYLGRDDATEMVHLRGFFLQCVDSVREEVRRRRSHAAAAAATSSSSSSSTSSSSSKAKIQERIAAKCTDPVNELEEFNSSDCVRVIERLLGHDEVLSFLYDHLFPPSSQQLAPSPGAQVSTSSVSTIHTSSNGMAVMGVSESSPALSKSSDHVYLQTMSPTKPAGSGANAAVAGRGNALPIDDFTRDYLRSMPRPHSGAS